MSLSQQTEEQKLCFWFLKNSFISHYLEKEMVQTQNYNVSNVAVLDAQKSHRESYYKWVIYDRPSKIIIEIIKHFTFSEVIQQWTKLRAWIGMIVWEHEGVIEWKRGVVSHEQLWWRAGSGTQGWGDRNSTL